MATFDEPDPTLIVFVVLTYCEGPNRNDPEVELPFGFTVAFNTTDLRVTLVAAPVTTVGRQAVVLNVASLPRTVPPALVTTARKWYTALHCNDAMFPLPIATALVPEPRPAGDVELP
jgi:hypothetical protein